MKKSKVIIPALGVLILSTAASVTGTVAWFTANRTATITAGEFAVVKTGNDLSVTLGTGVGTAVTNGVNPSVTTTSGYKLTDASFDHTVVVAGHEDEASANVVTPDVPRAKVLKNTALKDVDASEMLRGTNTYSAFTWTMEFTVSFSESANKKQGLFIDLSDSATYMHEKVKFTAEEAAALGVSGLYTDEACGTALTGDHPAANTDYYRVAPDHTGKAFRIAFYPTAVTTTGADCFALCKVWADNEGSAEGEGKFVDGVAAGSALAATAYSGSTVSFDGSDYAAASAGTVLMKSGDNSGIPTDGTLASSAALSGNSNYLGYFAPDAGKNVSITYTCVAWYDGTHPEIVGSATDFERIVASMKFGVTEFTD